MNPYTVILCLMSRGRCWVELRKGGKQDGHDIECATYRDGRRSAAHLCDIYGLNHFEETRIRNAQTILRAAEKAGAA